MDEKPIIFNSIGIIETPFTDLADMPIQPSAAEGVKGKVILNGFSHLILLYHFHQAGDSNLLVKPFLDENFHGVFATRAPRRPNAIGFSIVRLLEIQQNILTIANVDILNGTPLLDIKPYVPYFDKPEADRIGWLENFRGEIGGKYSDDRFLK